MREIDPLAGSDCESLNDPGVPLHHGPTTEL